MGTKIVSTEGAGLDGRGGTYTGLVRLRRTTVLSYYAGRYVWMQGTAEYEEQGVQWRGSLVDQGRDGDVPPTPIALLGWFVRDGYIPAG